MSGSHISPCANRFLEEEGPDGPADRRQAVGVSRGIGRRSLLRGVCAAAMVVGSSQVLAACGTGKGKSAQPATVAYGTTLVFQPYPFGYPVNTGFKIMQEILAPFEQQNKVNVKLELFSSTTGNVSALSGGAGPDIFFDQRYSPYLGSGLAVDLLPLLQQDGIDTSIWSKGLVDYFKQPEGMFATSCTIETMVYLVNLSDFDTMGISYPDPDWDINTFVSVAKQLKTLPDASANSQHFGANFPFQWDYVQNYQWLFQAFGASIGDVNGTRCLLGSDAAVSAGNWMFNNLIWDEVAVTRNSSRLKGQWDAKQFVAGEVSISDLPPIQIVSIIPSIPSSVKWQLYPLPVFPSGRFNWAAGGLFGINAQTKAKEQAWNLFKFLTVEDSWQQAMIQLNFLGPSKVSLWDNWQATALQLAPILKGKGLQYYVDAVQQGYAYPGMFFKYSDLSITPILQAAFDNLVSQSQTSVQAEFQAVADQINKMEQQVTSGSSTSA